MVTCHSYLSSNCAEFSPSTVHLSLMQNNVACAEKESPLTMCETLWAMKATELGSGLQLMPGTCLTAEPSMSLTVTFTSSLSLSITFTRTRKCFSSEWFYQILWQWHHQYWNESFLQVKAIYLTSDAFSVENGLLTPTLKARRPQLRAHYASVINDLYKAINQ